VSSISEVSVRQRRARAVRSLTVSGIAPLHVPVLDVGPKARSRREWAADMWAHREVLLTLSRKDFQTRYKRASLGVLWAVAVPVVQGAVMAVVFSRVIRVGGGEHFSAYVMSGILGWSYFSATLQSASTSVVDGSGLADKVWFPRAVLPIVPVLANTVGLMISYAVLLALLPILGADVGARLLLIPAAMILLVVWATGVGLVTSALYVYYRDVRFLVQASLLVWMYVTPIVYRKELLGSKGWLLDLNPMTGVVTLFHMAVAGYESGWPRPVAITVGVSLVLLIVGVEAHRRHERLFVDKL
jgi:lipopolysaccharide transport system permease protein